MSADTLRRLQALRGLTRVGSTHTVLAQVQGDLQTVIEAVLELAGHDDEHEHPTDEPAIGEQVTDREGDVWQRFEGGWCLWKGGEVGWSLAQHTWGYARTLYGPLRPTTDDDRRRVGLPVRDEDTPSASQDGPLAARSADSGTGGPPEPESAAQGRIGWLRLTPDRDYRWLVIEVEGRWTSCDDLAGVCEWPAKDWPDAEFTPIPTLAADEVAVKREDLRMVLEWSDDGSNGTAADADRIGGALYPVAADRVLDMVWIHESVPAVKRESVARLRAALEAGEGRG